MRSSTFLLLCLSCLLLCLLSPAAVQADGSIQPYIDSYCDHPTANATLIPVVSGDKCQWLQVSDGEVSFSYQCDPWGNFSLTFWSPKNNVSSYCAGTPDWSISALDIFNTCPVATYDDPNNHVPTHTHTHTHTC